jgi:hypothetical protein
MLVRYSRNFLYLFFLGSIAAAAGPLEIAKRALVEVLSLWLWEADMVDVEEGVARRDEVSLWGLRGC